MGLRHCHHICRAISIQNMFFSSKRFTKLFVELRSDFAKCLFIPERHIILTPDSNSFYIFRAHDGSDTGSTSGPITVIVYTGKKNRAFTSRTNASYTGFGICFITHCIVGLMDCFSPKMVSRTKFCLPPIDPQIGRFVGLTFKNNHINSCFF